MSDEGTNEVSNELIQKENICGFMWPYTIWIVFQLEFAWEFGPNFYTLQTISPAHLSGCHGCSTMY